MSNALQTQFNEIFRTEETQWKVKIWGFCFACKTFPRFTLSQQVYQDNNMVPTAFKSCQLCHCKYQYLFMQLVMKSPAMYEVKLSPFKVYKVNAWRCQICKVGWIIKSLSLLWLQSCRNLFFICDPKHTAFGRVLRWLISSFFRKWGWLMAKISKQSGRSISFIFLWVCFFIIWLCVLLKMSVCLCRVWCSLDRTRLWRWFLGSPVPVSLSHGQDLALLAFPVELGWGLPSTTFPFLWTLISRFVMSLRYLRCLVYLVMLW